MQSQSINPTQMRENLLNQVCSLPTNPLNLSFFIFLKHNLSRWLKKILFYFMFHFPLFLGQDNGETSSLQMNAAITNSFDQYI